MDILRAHRRPRAVMAKLLTMGQREDRAVAMVMAACVVMFMAQWPWRARQSHETGTPLSDFIQNDMFALIFFLPLVLYGLAALMRLLAKPLGGTGTWFTARLALFWGLLASTPLLILAGLTKGFIGPGSANTTVGVLWFTVFIWIWLSSMWEAETQ